MRIPDLSKPVIDAMHADPGSWQHEIDAAEVLEREGKIDPFDPSTIPHVAAPWCVCDRCYDPLGDR